MTNTTTRTALQGLEACPFGGMMFLSELGLTKKQTAFIFQDGAFLDHQWVANEPFNFETDHPDVVLHEFSVNKFCGNFILQSCRRAMGIVDRMEWPFHASRFMDKMINTKGLKTLEITPHNADQYQDGVKVIDTDVVVVAAPIHVHSISARVLIGNAPIVTNELFVSHYMLFVAKYLTVERLMTSCRGILAASILDVTKHARVRSVSVTLVDKDPLRIWANRMPHLQLSAVEPYETLIQRVFEGKEFSNADYPCDDGTLLQFHNTSWVTNFQDFYVYDPFPQPTQPAVEPEQPHEDAGSQVSGISDPQPTSELQPEAPAATPEPEVQSEVHTEPAKSEQSDDAQPAEAAPAAEEVTEISDSVVEEEEEQPQSATTDETDYVKIEAGAQKFYTQEELRRILSDGTTNAILEKLCTTINRTPDKSMGKSRKITFLCDLCSKDSTGLIADKLVRTLEAILVEEAGKDEDKDE